MASNNQTNDAIKWLIIIADFFVLNLLLWLFTDYHYIVKEWTREMKWVFLFGNNLALFLSELRFSTIVHQRIISAADILRRVMGLVCAQALVAYVLLKAMDYLIPAGRVMLMLLPPFFVLLLLSRLIERWAVKRFRRMGRNSRTVTFIGNDPELMTIYEKLKNDPTTGYRVKGYYADAEIGEWTHSSSKGVRREQDGEILPSSPVEDQQALQRLGTLQEFLQKIVMEPDNLHLGDELYVSLSRRDRDIIKRISQFCDHKVIRFYYVPVSVESLGMNLKREMLDDMEVYTTYEIPLANPVNKFVKRTFDIMASLVFLIPTAIMFPFIWAIIKIQSPGPIFFRQKRTGLDGKDFEMLKFRSMHVNKDADKLQATKDDPRKYPFGNFMRKSNIDELPQFLNVLKGDMSFVGPRPHMLLHTEQYSQLIDKYMVRHFVKPGLTGWAQVTGFRGETKELWQMEGRVKRDIWYIENWSIWLDIRIIWLTAKTIFIHDKNAY
ncbi:MAG: exopolysaccharide biosynthesis polyprenyl glycosylphosphotransferase [Prevotella sp.]|nr:exopolysaccharide biosynthesis polyprenyl glycosylphosphotransferase [Prevotella sp.]MBQ8152445.1 exopolysaccharide biosynthesis polyprenyl glycosylphosphotransferase [Prevotella sp.]